MAARMSSSERVTKLFNGQKPDRVAVLPQIGDHAGHIAGLPMDVIYHDGEKIADAHLRAYEKYRYDIAAVQVEPSWPVAEACGCEVVYPADKCPWITKNIIKKPGDVDKVKVPDFHSHPETGTILEATVKLKKEIGGEAVISGYMTGPLTFALQLMPYNDFVMGTKKDPAFVQAVVQKSTEIGTAFFTALREAGAEISVICEHDLQLFSPKMWREYCLSNLPAQTAVCSWNVLHTCGNVSAQLSALSEEIAGIPLLQFINFSHEVPIKAMIEAYNGSMGLCGNIDHIHLLPSATPAEVQDACRKTIEEGLKARAFMLGPGCEITIDTPEENVEAFVRSAELYGEY
jgi:uroporphyrinogen decarboxylase